MKLTINKLASKLCKLEGKKSSISIGNTREVLALLSDIFYAESETGCDSYCCLYDNGKARVKKRKKVVIVS